MYYDRQLLKVWRTASVCVTKSDWSEGSMCFWNATYLFTDIPHSPPEVCNSSDQPALDTALDLTEGFISDQALGCTRSKQVNFQLTRRHKMISELQRGAMYMYIARRIHSLMSIKQLYKCVSTYWSGLKGRKPIQFSQCSLCARQLWKLGSIPGTDKIFHYYTLCILAVGNIQLGLKRPWHEAQNWPQSRSDVKNTLRYAHTLHTSSYWEQGQLHNFTSDKA
jgi:hypothetical protein